MPLPGGLWKDTFPPSKPPLVNTANTPLSTPPLPSYHKTHTPKFSHTPYLTLPLPVGLWMDTFLPLSMAGKASTCVGHSSSEDTSKHCHIIVNTRTHACVHTATKCGIT
jgi:hypothetical protein